MEMLDFGRKKYQVRALQVERKRFEAELTNFDKAKRFISVDMRKAQTDMKRKLKRYKERQKEIAVSRGGDETDHRNVYGQFVTRPQTASSRLTSRPCTSSSYIKRMEKFLDSDQNEEKELDPMFLTDRTRSKIDLRPSSAWSVRSRPAVNTQNLEYRRLGLNLRTQNLGSPAAQIRYFDEEELEERNGIYSQILQQHKLRERAHFNEIALKVLNFCDKSGKIKNKMSNSSHHRFGCVISARNPVDTSSGVFNAVLDSGSALGYSPANYSSAGSGSVSARNAASNNHSSVFNRSSSVSALVKHSSGSVNDSVPINNSSALDKLGSVSHNASLNTSSALYKSGSVVDSSSCTNDVLKSSDGLGTKLDTSIDSTKLDSDSTKPDSNFTKLNSASTKFDSALESTTNSAVVCWLSNNTEDNNSSTGNDSDSASALNITNNSGSVFNTDAVFNCSSNSSPINVDNATDSVVGNCLKMIPMTVKKTVAFKVGN